VVDQRKVFRFRGDEPWKRKKISFNPQILGGGSNLDEYRGWKENSKGGRTSGANKKDVVDFSFSEKRKKFTIRKEKKRGHLLKSREEAILLSLSRGVRDLFI